MGALALRAEEGEQFCGLAAGAADPVRYLGVELCGLADAEVELLLAEHEPDAAVIAAELALDPKQWPTLRADMPRRRASGPGGQTAIVTDNFLLIQRAGA